MYYNKLFNFNKSIRISILGANGGFGYSLLAQCKMILDTCLETLVSRRRSSFRFSIAFERVCTELQELQVQLWCR